MEIPCEDVEGQFDEQLFEDPATRMMKGTAPVFKSTCWNPRKFVSIIYAAVSSELTMKKRIMFAILADVKYTTLLDTFGHLKQDRLPATQVHMTLQHDGIVRMASLRSSDNADLISNFSIHDIPKRSVG